jgi:predicted 3-demethylubiquinone-9 3-methyltransferase (glyoxalase superfamily)
MASTQKITPFLWFDNNAEEAMTHYTSIFKNSKILSLTRNGKGGPGPEGSVLVGSFELEGVEFNALNGGPMFKFNEAISMVVHCDSQDEVDHFWAHLCEGGSPSQCGWLKDKFGLSWQIVPRIFVQLVQDPDPAKSQRVMQAMMQMTKFDIAALQRAHRGE